MFIPIDLIGGSFKVVAQFLPFYHGVRAIKLTLSGDYSGLLPHLAIVLIYAATVYLIAVFAFKKKMFGNK